MYKTETSKFIFVSIKNTSFEISIRRVAQLEERRILTPKVAGSNPAAPAKTNTE